MDEILAPLTEILEGVLQADQQLMEKTKAKVFSAFITVLQMKEMRGEGPRGAGAALAPLVADLVRLHLVSSHTFLLCGLSCWPWNAWKSSRKLLSHLSPPHSP